MHLGVPRVAKAATTVVREFNLSSRPSSARSNKADEPVEKPLFSSFGKAAAKPPTPRNGTVATKPRGTAMSTKIPLAKAPPVKTQLDMAPPAEAAQAVAAPQPAVEPDEPIAVAEAPAAPDPEAPAPSPAEVADELTPPVMQPNEAAAATLVQEAVQEAFAPASPAPALIRAEEPETPNTVEF